MGQYDFDYTIPTDFDKRVMCLLDQLHPNKQLRDAFAHCTYEREDLGNAYYAGMRGDNWNMNALDFTFEGPSEHITILRNNKTTLKDCLQKALRPSKSGYLVRDVLLLAASSTYEYPTSDEKRLHEAIATANGMLNDIVKICGMISVNHTYSSSSSENSINDFLRDQLIAMGYNETRDQTRHGSSTSGLDAGEVDILVAKNGKEVALIEGMKLSCVNSTYIDSHVMKATSSYNPLGTATFIIAYYHGDGFQSFWTRYSEYLQEHDCQYGTTGTMEQMTSPNAATRVMSAVLSHDGFSFPVYFIAVNLAC